MDDRQLRLKQRVPLQLSSATPDYTFTRGASSVPSTGTVRLIFQGGVTNVAIFLTLGTVPVSGAWSLSIPSLLGESSQVFGSWMVLGTATGSVPAKIVNGVITPIGTAPEPGNGGTLTISGVIS